MKGSETITQGMKVILAVFFGVAILLIAGCILTLKMPGSDGPLTDFDYLISQAALRYGVEANLIKAVIKQESDFDPSAKNEKTGATGLMQIKPNTAEGLGKTTTPEGKHCNLDITDLLDPEQNINGGTCYLSYLLDRYDNNKELALAAYNAGPSKVDACKCVPNIQETQQYVRLVKKYYDEYKGQGGWTAVG